MTDTTLVAISVAALAALPSTIAAMAAYRAAKAVHKTAVEVIQKTDENTVATLATKKTVDRVETQTNGHLSIMTVNVQNLEAKLEMALKQNGELQVTNANIVEMMKSLVEAEAKDKKDIVRAIELNGTSGGGPGAR